MPKLRGSFPNRHCQGAENISLPKCTFFLLTARFYATYVAENQLHSPRARCALECKPTMAEDRD
eukprot:329107-Chlamydomonas_euryale.AAC.16